MSKRSTFDVLFYVKRNQPLKDGSLPIMCRIAVNGTKSCFSGKMSVPAELWDGGKAVGRSDAAKRINRDLTRVEESLRNHHRRLEERDAHISAEKVKNAYLGLSMNHETLLKVYEQFIVDYGKLKEAGLRERSSYNTFITVYGHLKDFIGKRYRQGDIGLKDLTPAFITDFEIFLKTDKACCHNSVVTYMKRLRKMISVAIKNRLLTHDPFIDYSIRAEDTVRERLDSKEIKALIGADLTGNEALARDMFVFCTFTGLAYIDLRTLRREDIHRDGNGHFWITKKREKTGIESVVRLMDIPKRILEKYDGLGTEGFVFPVPGYTDLMKYIKSAAKVCGIEKNVTWHVARHTMSTEVCLTNGMPIETLSKMLGHKNIRTTQIYAKVTQKKSNYDMDMLENRLNQISDFRELSVTQ